MERLTLIALLLVAAFGFGTASVAHSQEPARTIEIHARQFAFVPAEITVKKGETVKLVLTSDDVPHSLLIPDLDVNAPMIKGKLTDVMLIPTKDGDFQGVCGKFCGKGHGAMLFKVHITN
jgi:cytochrome c oxidase subunit II